MENGKRPIRKKRVCNIILIVLLVLTLIYVMFNIVLWQKGMPERFFKYSITEKDTVQIDYYTGPFFLLNIPDTIEGKQVTSIGCGYDTDPAYFQCHETFADMKYLREVSLQQSLKSIGNNAFANCIPSYIFIECYSLEKITIPASVEEIGERYMNTFAELAGSAFFCEKKSWDILTNQ